MPDAPGAWLTTVARNAALDVLRRRSMEERKLREMAGVALTGSGEMADPETITSREWDEDADDRLRLLFTCAHPALGMDARVALTLHAVAGLTTREIARAFFVSESTLAQRLVRAKRRIRGAGIPFRVPSAAELPERLDGVLAVLYLVFSEGYSASSGEAWMRLDLCSESIRVLRLVIELLGPLASDEACALLALMLLQHSRRTARLDQSGELVPLDEQDRGGWDSGLVDEARTLLQQPYLVRGGYRVQAELAAEHAFAPDARSTNWTRIRDLYDELQTFTGSPMVRLNRAIARGFAEGFEAGLSEVEALEASGQLGDSHLIPATRADFLRRLGRRDEAHAAYRAAVVAAPTEAERRYLARRIAEVGES